MINRKDHTDSPPSLSFLVKERVSTVFLAKRETSFCQNKIKFSIERIFYHLIESGLFPLSVYR